MKTFSPKSEDVTREWFVVDVKGKTLGKVSTKIANILRGKHKTIFSPHVDCGDYVVIVNAKEIHLSGNKLDQKKYYRHSEYPSGLKSEKASNLLERKPELLVKRAIAGMVPHNKLHDKIVSKLKIYAGPEHEQQAQNPKTLEI